MRFKARGVVSSAVVGLLRTESDRLAAAEPDAAHGIRDLPAKSPIVRHHLTAPWLQALLPAGYGCVRGILFDKRADANWLVAWHQDLTICVKERQQVAGYGPWSVKHGVPHVQPPMALLDAMITLRLHLDEATHSNGALRVLPGTHRFGRLDAQQIEAFKKEGVEETCTAAAGDVLLMKPLLLHASSKAESPAHRRVVHLEFAPLHSLAACLQWHE